MELRERIAALRNQGITQSAIAEKAGVSQPTISAIAKGYDVLLSSAQKIDAALISFEKKHGNASK